MRKTSNLLLLINLLMIAAGMLMMAYASVPLYRIFCQATGFGGQARRAEHRAALPGSRFMTVRFDANLAPNLAWTFAPVTRGINLRVGEERHVEYQAVNRGAQTATGTAVFNITPVKAGQYFNKIQCFCFTEQTLKPGESKKLGVTFFLDPALEKDPDLLDVRTITLSYTFFPVKR